MPPRYRKRKPDGTYEYSETGGAGWSTNPAWSIATADRSLANQSAGSQPTKTLPTDWQAGRDVQWPQQPTPQDVQVPLSSAETSPVQTTADPVTNAIQNQVAVAAKTYTPVKADYGQGSTGSSNSSTNTVRTVRNSSGSPGSVNNRFDPMSSKGKRFKDPIQERLWQQRTNALYDFYSQSALGKPRHAGRFINKSIHKTPDGRTIAYDRSQNKYVEIQDNPYWDKSMRKMSEEERMNALRSKWEQDRIPKFDESQFKFDEYIEDLSLPQERRYQNKLDYDARRQHALEQERNKYIEQNRPDQAALDKEWNEWNQRRVESERLRRMARNDDRDLYSRGRTLLGLEPAKARRQVFSDKKLKTPASHVFDALVRKY